MKTNLKSDWIRVCELAAEIANASAVKDAKYYDKKRIKMLKLLDFLIKKHGRHPSIVATKADYVVRKSDRVRLLKLALKISKRIGDVKNTRMVSDDLKSEP